MSRKHLYSCLSSVKGVRGEDGVSNGVSDGVNDDVSDNTSDGVSVVDNNITYASVV